MTAAKSVRKILLDWSRLLAFDQATDEGAHAGREKLQDPRMAKLGAKMGVKGISHGGKSQ